MTGWPLSHRDPSAFKVTTYWADGWVWAAEARGSWTPRLCKSTMDKEVIMKKTSKKNMMSIMGMIIIDGRSKSRILRRRMVTAPLSQASFPMRKNTFPYP